MGNISLGPVYGVALDKPRSCAVSHPGTDTPAADPGATTPATTPTTTSATASSRFRNNSGQQQLQQQRQQQLQEQQRQQQFQQQRSSSKSSNRSGNSNTATEATTPARSAGTRYTPQHPSGSGGNTTRRKVSRIRLLRPTHRDPSRARARLSTLPRRPRLPVLPSDQSHIAPGPAAPVRSVRRTRPRLLARAGNSPNQPAPVGNLGVKLRPSITQHAPSPATASPPSKVYTVPPSAIARPASNGGSVLATAGSKSVVD